MSVPSKYTPMRAPRVRLDTLRTTPRPPTRISRPTPKSTSQCANPNCTRSDVGEEDGKLICRSCGFVVSDVQITQELTFGEAANGAAVVQGVYVGANEENARSAGLGPSKLTGGMDSRQVTERNGQHHISNLVAALRLSVTQKERANLMWTLAMNQNFIQGRVTRHVAAVCLYIACRHDKDCRLMLVDFSDLLEMNVFKLGQIYTAFVEALHLNETHLNLGLVNPENLIHRFAQDLEFGPDEHRIANEAVQVLKRLDRDWITTGRRPAGVCAAALILAARMNNYRRTVREVVYTAKVCEITINKRLDEFRFTDSSKLTVEEFRHHGENLAAVHDPPAFYQQFEAKKKGRRSKKTAAAEGSESDQTPQAEGGEVNQTPADPRTVIDKARRDNAAMPPPPPPIDPALLPSESEDQHLAALALAENANDEHSEDDGGTPIGGKRKRGVGRPKGARNKPLPSLAEADVADEVNLENEVQSFLQQPGLEEQATAAHQQLNPEPNRASPAQPIKNSQKDSSRSQPAGGPGYQMLDEEIISESEFNDDPDVAGAVLTNEERKIKERIWVIENGDYLRMKQARKIRSELAVAGGTAHVPKKRMRAKKPRMGDTAHYGTQRDEHGNIIGTSSPAESVKMMLSHRGYSKKLDYATVEKLYKHRSHSFGDRSASAFTSTRASSEVSEHTSPSGPASDAAARARANMPTTGQPATAGPSSQQEPIVIEDGGEESSEDDDDGYFATGADELDGGADDEEEDE